MRTIEIYTSNPQSVKKSYLQAVEKCLEMGDRIIVRVDSVNSVELISGYEDFELMFSEDTCGMPIFDRDKNDCFISISNGKSVTEEQRYGLFELMYDVFGGIKVNNDKFLQDYIGFIYSKYVAENTIKRIKTRLMKKNFIHGPAIIESEIVLE